MKKVKLTTEKKGKHLFKSLDDKEYQMLPYCTGKYAWKGTRQGETVDVLDNVTAIWIVRRKDIDGPYSKLMCIRKRNIEE